MTNIEDYFSGKKLYGDDFSFEQITKWYEEEAEAYAQMYGINDSEANFDHNANIMHGYKYLENIQSFNNVLGLGSSWGYEFLPIIDKIQNLHIVDTSEQTISEKLAIIKPTYHKPTVSGKIDFPDNTFDLINVFSTIHHIPNVTYILNELFRVLKPGGYLLLKEPVNSMGDWRTKREGLTTHERGIPPLILEKIIKDANMQIVSKQYYQTMTSFFIRTTKLKSFFQSNIYYFIDKYLSNLLIFNMHYHPTKKRQRICPTTVFYVLRKK